MTAAIVALALALGSVGNPAIGGNATWYKYHEGQAAAGPALRDALGPDWRGQTVTVCADRCIAVRLSDWCACGDRHGKATLLDLDARDFARLAPLSSGIVEVSVELGGIVLPATDTEVPDLWHWLEVVR